MVLFDGGYRRQGGLVLLMGLVFLLLLSLIGLSSMQLATAQQKVAGSLWHRNQSFQSAESGLRLGEASVRHAFSTPPLCQSVIACAPPAEAFSVMGAGVNPVSGVAWASLEGGLYGMQYLGLSVGVVHLPPSAAAALYRVTAVGLNGHSRTVLESLYARVEEEGGSRFRRVAWRQLQ
jgi:type IV pilus assembly protein PilX